MTDQVVFDQDAVGVVSSSNWSDSEMINRISYRYNDPIYTAPRTVAKLPDGGHGGVIKLGKALGEYLPLAQTCSKELSDACAALGSGAETSIANFDSAETMSAEAYSHLRERMGQKAMGDD